MTASRCPPAQPLPPERLVDHPSDQAPHQVEDVLAKAPWSGSPMIGMSSARSALRSYVRTCARPTNPTNTMRNAAKGEREVRPTVISIIRDHLRDPNSTITCLAELSSAEVHFDSTEFRRGPPLSSMQLYLGGLSATRNSPVVKSLSPTRKLPAARSTATARSSPTARFLLAALGSPEVTTPAPHGTYRSAGPSIHYSPSAGCSSATYSSMGTRRRLPRHGDQGEPPYSGLTSAISDQASPARSW